MSKNQRISNEENAKKILVNIFTILMLCFLTGCAALPSIIPAIFQVAEEVVDVGVEIEIDKEKLKKDTDGHLSIDVKDK